ncbi:MAG: hypothetical protein NVS4B11_19680 [Ktedonobacteraceae bacterium]
MAACTRCGFQQNGTQAYCERCGMFLPALAIYNPGQPEYTVIPQVMPYQKPKIVEGRLTTAMIIDRCVGAVVSLFGFFMAAFGLFGGLYILTGSGFALLLGLVLFIAGIIFVSIFLFVQKPLPHFLWWQRIVGGLGATMIGFIMILVVSMMLQTHKAALNACFGAAFFLYGLILVAIALW